MSDVSRETYVGILTPREQEVLSHVVSGESNKVIASALNCSKRTVDQHLRNIMNKTGVRKRYQLINEENEHV